MMQNRRRFLLGGTGTIAIAAGTFGAFAVSERRLLEIISEAFGRRMAESAATSEFIAALDKSFLDRLKDWNGMDVCELFVKHTTVIQALETGDELIFVGLEDPRQNPCANPLSVHWL